MEGRHLQSDNESAQRLIIVLLIVSAPPRNPIPSKWQRGEPSLQCGSAWLGLRKGFGEPPFELYEPRNVVDSHGASETDVPAGAGSLRRRWLADLSGLAGPILRKFIEASIQYPGSRKLRVEFLQKT
eukprot:2609244-Amphidinium_carterae.2